MNTRKIAEDYILRIDDLFSMDEFAQGKELLDELLILEPEFGHAHFMYAWLYQYKLCDYEKAEQHYQFAIQFAPNLSLAYENYLIFLNSMERYHSTIELIKEVLKVPAINKDTVYSEYAKALEQTHQYNKAIEAYIYLIHNSANHYLITECKSEIKRITGKQNLSKMNSTFPVLCYQ